MRLCRRRSFGRPCDRRRSCPERHLSPPRRGCSESSRGLAGRRRMADKKRRVGMFARREQRHAAQARPSRRPAKSLIRFDGARDPPPVINAKLSKSPSHRASDEGFEPQPGARASERQRIATSALSADVEDQHIIGLPARPPRRRLDHAGRRARADAHQRARIARGRLRCDARDKTIWSGASSSCPAQRR